MDSVEEMRLVDTVDVLNWFTVLEINIYKKRRGVLIFGLEKSLIRFSFPESLVSIVVATCPYSCHKGQPGSVTQCDSARKAFEDHFYRINACWNHGI